MEVVASSQYCYNGSDPDIQGNNLPHLNHHNNPCARCIPGNTLWDVGTQKPPAPSTVV
uniref:Uncharacterized protein n=1 Tax=Ciona intestinalis TaxID=7719 RepID=H2XXP2_CIOIN